MDPITLSYYFFSRAFFVIKSKIDSLFSGNSAIILHQDYNKTNFKIFHGRFFKAKNYIYAPTKKRRA